MKTLDCDVVIVGSGVAGLFLACNLRHTDLKVIVVERNKKIPDVNKGDQLAPCTVKMLGELGALENFEKRGSSKLNKMASTGSGTRRYRKFRRFRGSDASSLQLYFRLASCTDSRVLIRDSYAERYCRSNQGFSRKRIYFWMTTVLLVASEGSKTRMNIKINARLVAGCDGPRSKIRELAGIKTELEQWPYDVAMLTCSRK